MQDFETVPIGTTNCINVLRDYWYATYPSPVPPSTKDLTMFLEAIIQAQKDFIKISPERRAKEEEGIRAREQELMENFAEANYGEHYIGVNELREMTIQQLTDYLQSPC